MTAKHLYLITLGAVIACVAEWFHLRYQTPRGELMTVATGIIIATYTDMRGPGQRPQLPPPAP